MRVSQPQVLCLSVTGLSSGLHSNKGPPPPCMAWHSLPSPTFHCVETHPFPLPAVDRFEISIFPGRAGRESVADGRDRQTHTRRCRNEIICRGNFPGRLPPFATHTPLVKIGSSAPLTLSLRTMCGACASRAPYGLHRGETMWHTVTLASSLHTKGPSPVAEFPLRDSGECSSK